MPILPYLPDELLVQIVNYLLPDDVDNFSKSHKEFHTIARRVVPRHEEFKDKYDSFFWGPEEQAHPIFLLRDVLQNPEIVWYVKVIELEHCNDAFIEIGKEVWGQIQKVAMECKDGIIKTMKAFPYLDDDEREPWISAILSCHRNSIVALLTCMAPCLENIKLTDYWENEKLHRLVRKVDQAKHLDFGSPHAFSMLNHVEEGGSTSEALTYMRSFELFSRLPAMRRYTGRHLYQDTPWTPPEENSTITSLELYECIIHIEALRSVLSAIANLQVFTYKFWNSPRLAILENNWGEHQRAKEARERLQPIPGKREEDNYIDWSNDTAKPFMGSLRGFEVLKYVRVQNNAFVEERSVDFAGGRTVHRLVDLLPASVEIVTLAKPQLSKKDSYRLLEGLPELKGERVPKLEMVDFESDKQNRKTPNRKMKLKFQADGIELIL